MFSKIEAFISNLDIDAITSERKKTLDLLVDFIQNKIAEKQDININFICTHNSRRSHLAQIWMQTLAHFFAIDNLYSYSGGTESTAMALPVISTLKKQGFDINVIVQDTNPIYAIKYHNNSHPIIGFSKNYEDTFNPSSKFAAVMTCSQADGGCPFIAGAEKRIPITFEDPKLYDGSDQEENKYEERSLQIATEMLYVMSKALA